MMKKKTAVLVTVLVAALVCAATVLTMVGVQRTWTLTSPQANPTAASSSGLDTALLQQINQVFADHGLAETDAQTMIDNAAKGLVYGTGDVYANYYTREEFQKYQSDRTGQYVGVGVQVTMNYTENTITVAEVYEDSPARGAGMQAGDVIATVDGQDISSVPIDDVINMVKGEAGTQVTLGVLRNGEPVEMTMERQAVVQHRVKSMMATADIGYIRIKEFAGDCYEGFEAALDALVNQGGAKAIILDLRNNPGGDKDLVCKIADRLMPEGPIIVTENKQGQTQEDDSDANMLGLPMVVLINGDSASASELLAGGIQDYKVGTLLGTTTFGKGVVQEFFTIPSTGGVLRLTTQRYLTAGGRSVQDVGVTPDVELEASEELKANSLLIATEQDNQYQKAIELLQAQFQS